jgi:hypothetical protein
VNWKFPFFCEAEASIRASASASSNRANTRNHFQRVASEIISFKLDNYAPGTILTAFLKIGKCWTDSNHFLKTFVVPTPSHQISTVRLIYYLAEKPWYWHGFLIEILRQAS